MKKQYNKPETFVVLAATNEAILAAVSGGGDTNNSATIGNSGENGTGDKTIGSTDTDEFIQEGKYNAWSEWDD